MTKATMDNARLSELFGGRDRFRVLHALYVAPVRRFSNAELADEAGVPRSNAHKWLAHWANLGIVRRFVEGRNITYQASDDPLLGGLSEIMLQADSLVEDIRAALPAKAPTAVIFGSVARGEEDAQSDVDVLVLGDDLSSIRINGALKPVGRKHHRDIRATVFSQSEFEKLLRDENSFVMGLLSRPTIVIKGQLPYAKAHTGADSAK
jgi:hypothetical protein